MVSRLYVELVRREDLPENCDIVGCVGTGDESYLLVLDSSGIPRAYSDLIQRIEDVHFSKALYWVPDELRKVYKVGYSDGVNDTLVKIFGRRLLNLFRSIRDKLFPKEVVIEHGEQVVKHMITKRKKAYVEDDSIGIDGRVERREP